MSETGEPGTAKIAHEALEVCGLRMGTKGYDTHCMISQPGHAGPMARLSRITVADILELSLDQQARFDGFVNRRANGRPLDVADFIAMVEMKLGPKVRPSERGRKPHAGRWIDMRYSYHVPVMP